MKTKINKIKNTKRNRRHQDSYVKQSKLTNKEIKEKNKKNILTNGKKKKNQKNIDGKNNRQSKEKNYYRTERN